jgi:hypothetical protein
MKILLNFVGFLVLLCLGTLVYKTAQKACWENNASFVNPPSLDSWDPTERAEAARQAGMKYGGKK